MNTTLANYIESLDFSNISEERKDVLKPLIEFLQEKNSKKIKTRLNFICTHNSRRSHLCQVWAQTAAFYYNFKTVYCYSGGTEATAMFPMVAETLENTGFEVQKITEGDNPVYGVKYDHNEPPIVGFSKRFNDAFNPETRFVAVMTCSQADAGCPFIAGAQERVAVTYEDPKAFDGTTQQAEKYSERSLQIAEEMFYVFSKIK
ncbi:protein-tyrosine-phosphatase [Formosa sp. PL04]|uniref:arsenate-mycothiol transferase ArsC n=1 Tax=Formosa sp. PL04 TaxID=3081755 RepID=UPI002982B826|nr:protein-tyrosine-phosphatase [Formosa sp. PL04]MDW5288474.1 protein-tyrosine-phosphatase [Formosa sp. PL04]